MCGGEGSSEEESYYHCLQTLDGEGHLSNLPGCLHQSRKGEGERERGRVCV